MKSIIEFGAAMILALIPSIVLYLIFQDLNQATFRETGIELGGPAALFFIVLYSALRFIKKRPYSADPLAQTKREISGSWKVTAESAHGHKAESTCNIEYLEGNINITGGQFISQGKAIGTWQVLGFFLNNNSLTYVYQLTEAGGSGMSVKGLVTLNIEKNQLSGFWEQIGKEYKSGTINYVRQ